jgi:hypothetical protein
MVKIKYMGRLGNKMFQYALGRYFAEEMGYRLVADPLPFPMTWDAIQGDSHTAPEQVLTKQHCDCRGILADKTPRAIVLNGYFQRSEFYLPFMERIRQWFYFSIPPGDRIAGVSPEDVLVYVRLGDYHKMEISLTSQFYLAAIEMARPRRVFIACEEPEHPFLDVFARYNPNIISLKARNPLIDLWSARLFDKIVMSCSSFAWWAAVLSDAAEVYFPIDRSGVWSGCNTGPSSSQISDLRIDDPRFTYFYNCSTRRNGDASTLFAPVSELNPQLLAVHKRSKAYWFQSEPL